MINNLPSLHLDNKKQSLSQGEACSIQQPAVLRLFAHDCLFYFLRLCVYTYRRLELYFEVYTFLSSLLAQPDPNASYVQSKTEKRLRVPPAARYGPAGAYMTCCLVVVRIPLIGCQVSAVCSTGGAGGAQGAGAGVREGLQGGEGVGGIGGIFAFRTQ